MGIANILAAKSIVLFAYGESKAQAIKGTVEGERTEKVPKCPSGTSDVTIIADKGSLELVKSIKTGPIVDLFGLDRFFSPSKYGTIQVIICWD